MNSFVGDVCLKIGKLLVYLPVQYVKLCLKLVKFFRRDPQRLLVFFCVIGVVSLSSLLVRRAARKRLAVQIMGQNKVIFESQPSLLNKMIGQRPNTHRVPDFDALNDPNLFNFSKLDRHLSQLTSDQ